MLLSKQGLLLGLIRIIMGIGIFVNSWLIKKISITIGSNYHNKMKK